MPQPTKLKGRLPARSLLMGKSNISPPGVVPPLRPPQRRQESAANCPCGPLSPAPKFSLPHARSTSAINLEQRLPSRGSWGHCQRMSGIYRQRSLETHLPVLAHLSTSSTVQGDLTRTPNRRGDGVHVQGRGGTEKPGSDPKPGRRHPEENWVPLPSQSNEESKLSYLSTIS